MGAILKNIDRILTSSNTEIDLENIQASGDGGMELGIQANVLGENIDYTFGVTPISSITEMDTSSLPVGSTLIWDGGTWKSSDLIIESYT